MKRVWAVICLTLFIAAQTLTHVKVSASTTGSFGLDIVDYLTLGGMSIALQEGAELSWADLDLGDAALSAEEKARRMLGYYRDKAWQLEKTGLLGIVDMMSDVDIIEAETPAISLSMNSGLESSTISDINTQVLNRALDSNSPSVRMHMDAQAIAYFNKYNTASLNDFLDNMRYEAESGEASSDVPVNLQVLVDQMAVIYMWATNTNWERMDFTNVTVRNGDYGERFFWNNRENYSYARVPGEDGYVPTNLLSIYVNEVDGEYVISCPEFIKYTSSEHVWGYNYYGDTYYQVGLPESYRESDNSITIKRRESSWINRVEAPTGTFQTLSDAITYINENYIHIQNLYVNGVNWIVPGADIDTGWSVDVPDAVTDTGTEDGKIINAPIFWAVDETTGEHIDDWDVNLEKMMDMIITKMEDGVTSVDLQDLLDVGALEKDGTAIGVGTGVVAGTKSLADAIAHARDLSITANPAITLEGVAAEAVPGLPSLPLMAPGMPGFQGVTVLARIVNFTNQSLPSELVTVFWGVVFGAVILGVIKVLHK